jgi:hypothetical protein
MKIEVKKIEIWNHGREYINLAAKIAYRIE